SWIASLDARDDVVRTLGHHAANANVERGAPCRVERIRRIERTAVRPGERLGGLCLRDPEESAELIALDPDGRKALTRVRRGNIRLHLGGGDPEGIRPQSLPALLQS